MRTPIATFTPGEHVTVTSLIDKQGDSRFVGKRGVVIRRMTEPISGESVEDPGYLVAFHGLGRDLFWPEELEHS